MDFLPHAIAATCFNVIRRPDNCGRTAAHRVVRMN
jgi:hypothetical protein